MGSVGSRCGQRALIIFGGGYCNILGEALDLGDQVVGLVSVRHGWGCTPGETPVVLKEKKEA